MKEYEIVAKFFNACSGAARPQTFLRKRSFPIPAIMSARSTDGNLTGFSGRPFRTGGSFSGSITEA